MFDINKKRAFPLSKRKGTPFKKNKVFDKELVLYISWLVSSLKSSSFIYTNSISLFGAKVNAPFDDIIGTLLTN